jgi:hypothetical protein
MSATRQIAMRLALYLDCIGAKPLLIGNSYKEYCDELRIQYQSIEPGLRKEGRRKGRKLIRETAGLDRVACHLVPVLPPAQYKIAKWRRRSENYNARYRSGRQRRRRAQNARCGLVYQNAPGPAGNVPKRFDSASAIQRCGFTSVP